MSLGRGLNPAQVEDESTYYSIQLKFLCRCERLSSSGFDHRCCGMRDAEQASGMNSNSKSLEHFPSGGTMWVMRPSTGVRCVTVCSGRPDIPPPCM